MQGQLQSCKARLKKINIQTAEQTKAFNSTLQEENLVKLGRTEIQYIFQVCTESCSTIMSQSTKFSPIIRKNLV